MSRVPMPKKKTDVKTSSKTIPRMCARNVPSGTQISMVSKRDTTSGLGKQLAKVAPSDEQIEVPSQLQKQVFRQALSKSAREPGKIVKSVGASRTQVAPPVATTKRGKERVIQQMKMQTTVQRTPKGEYIGKSMVGIDVGPTGVARKIEMTSHQIDPTHATESAGVNETVSATSTLSITTGGKQIKKAFKKKVLKSNKLAPKLNLNPHHINRLVREETEDVENTLKMVPPELDSASEDKLPLKRKIQSLRLTAEPVNVLTQSIILPTPTADEVDVEAPPEVLASVMDAVEKGATPNSAPNQIFNSLFPEAREARIEVSSIAPGPLEDIVVPTDYKRQTLDDALNEEMEEFLISEVQNKQELPKDNICTENNIIAATPTVDGDKVIPMLIEGELPPWEDATVNQVATIIGGEPINLLEASDVSILESPADISQELSKGIDYFIDADVAPYETKVQIRGSKLPKWFPGYMSAFPHLPGLVKIARTPSEVLHSAWKAVQPKIFPEDSLLIA